MIKSNINFKKIRQLSPFRKLAVNSWNASDSPLIFVNDDFNIENVLTFLKAHNEKIDIKVTLTHFCIKAFAICFEKYPDLNRSIVRNKVVQRDHVDVFCPVMVKNNKFIDLSGVCINASETKSIDEIAFELSFKARRLRDGQDLEMNRVNKILELTPDFLQGFNKNI